MLVYDPVLAAQDTYLGVNARLVLLNAHGILVITFSSNYIRQGRCNHITTTVSPRFGVASTGSVLQV